MLPALELAVAETRTTDPLVCPQHLRTQKRSEGALAGKDIAAAAKRQQGRQAQQAPSQTALYRYAFSPFKGPVRRADSARRVQVVPHLAVAQQRLPSAQLTAIIFTALI